MYVLENGHDFCFKLKSLIVFDDGTQPSRNGKYVRKVDNGS